MRSFIAVADDIGLSRGNTDTILQAADAGALQGVSILANGEALSYACEALLKRPSLMPALHCNLTEGKALSAPRDIPFLADANGFFKHSVLTLWAAYFFSFPARRAALRAQAGKELSAQLAAVRKQGLTVSRADGHQHVHMLPFVFDALIALPGIRRVRMPRETLYVGPKPFIFCKKILPVAILNVLSQRALHIARARGIAVNDYALGVLYSGHMDTGALAAGLAALSPRAGEVEIILHPGSAKEGELGGWQASGADTVWHYSPWREKERNLAMNELGRMLPGRMREGTVGKIVRFIISGLSAAAVDLILLWALTSVWGLWYIYSAVLAFVAAVGVSFSLQKFWTFKDRGAVPPQLALFLGVQLFSLALNTAGVYLLVERAGLWYLFAQICMIAVISVLNFFVFELVIFSSAPSSLFRGLLGGMLRVLPESAPQWIYTTLLRPRPLRALAHLLLRRVIPPTLPINEGTLILNQNDPVLSAALALGVYEPGIVRKWRELLHDDSQVLDIGANIGLFTLVAARHASKGTVIAFEPQSENAQFLSRMIAHNGLTNVVTVNAGASDSTGQASLYLHPDNKGMHSLLPVGSTQEHIALVRADDVVTEHQMSPTLIKIDVEGWEAKAFRGLEGTLRRYHPAILFEFAPARIRAAGDDPDALLEHLRGLGYVLTTLEDNNGYQNILAL